MSGAATDNLRGFEDCRKLYILNIYFATHLLNWYVDVNAITLLSERNQMCVSSRFHGEHLSPSRAELIQYSGHDLAVFLENRTLVRQFDSFTIGATMEDFLYRVGYEGLSIQNYELRGLELLGLFLFW